MTELPFCSSIVGLALVTIWFLSGIGALAAGIVLQYTCHDEFPDSNGGLDDSSIRCSKVVRGKGISFLYILEFWPVIKTIDTFVSY